MITIEILKEARKEFESNFKSLVTDTSEIRQRIEDIRTHSLRVAANALFLSKALLNNEEEFPLAEISGLFHDFGRALLIHEGTASPTNIQRDHANLSAQLIQKMGFFSKIDLADAQIILKAIESHNQLKSPKLDSEQQFLFARLLRDADKLDILETSYYYFKEKKGIQPIVTFDLLNNAEVSDKIIKCIMAGKTAAFEDMRSMNDYKLLLISMAFDINFKNTFRIVSEKQFVQKIYETLPKRDQIIDAFRGIKLFVENKFIS